MKASEKGFTFIEVVIALAILGIIAVGFLGGLTTASKGLQIADERETANNLAESQIESIKGQPYIDYSEELHDFYMEVESPPHYGINISAVPFDGVTHQPYPDLGGGIFEQDRGIQKITVTIDHQGKEVLKLESYKVNY